MVAAAEQDEQDRGEHPCPGQTSEEQPVSNQLWLWKRTKTTLCPLGWGEEDLKKGLKTCPPDNLHTAARWLKMAIGWGLLLDSQNCLLWDAGFLFS